MPGALSVPKPDPNKKMPEIIERDGGVRVVYVRPFFHAAEIKRERKEKERQTTYSKRPISYVDAREVLESVNVPAGAVSMVSEDNDIKLISSYDIEQGVDNSQDTKGSDAGPNAAVATPPAENSATDLVQLTESMLNEALPRLSSADRALGKGPSADENVDDESWTRISNGSYGDMETA